MSTTFFSSLRNSLKRDTTPPVGKTEVWRLDMAAPSISAYTGQLKVTGAVIQHNLGYVPVFRYYYEPFRDGVIWPPLSGRLTGDAQNPTNTSQLGPGIIGWADSTNFYLQLFSDTLDPDFTGTFPVYYVVYKDFKLS